MANNKRGSQALIQSMINQHIQYVFGIPGAKVDQLFEDLQYSDQPNAPKLIVTRHEQNAASTAAGIGRLTGKPGVVLTAIWPGVPNLVAALMTASRVSAPLTFVDSPAHLQHLSTISPQPLAT